MRNRNFKFTRLLKMHCVALRCLLITIFFSFFSFTNFFSDTHNWDIKLLDKFLYSCGQIKSPPCKIFLFQLKNMKRIFFFLIRSSFRVFLVPTSSSWTLGDIWSNPYRVMQKNTILNKSLLINVSRLINQLHSVCNKVGEVINKFRSTRIKFRILRTLKFSKKKKITLF